MTRMYPMVRDHRTQTLLAKQKTPHTGGSSSEKNLRAIPVKVANPSPKGLAKPANPVILVHKTASKAGTGIPTKTNLKVSWKDQRLGEPLDDTTPETHCTKQRAVSAFKRKQLQKWIIDSGAAFHLVRKGDLPISVQRHI